MLLSRRTFLSTTACALATLAAPSLIWGETAESVASGSASATTSDSGSAASAASGSGSASTAAGSTASGSASSSASYAVGFQEYGFTLTEVGNMDCINATKLVFTHDATGARVFFLKNDDPNRAFVTVFQTAPIDDTGMLHILEHAECSASDKYPGRDVFMYSVSNCYLTDINASTYDNATRYYAASLDEDQLAVLSDFFMDCAFHSAVATNEDYFKSEAWRYELADADSDLTLTGIVYNEMQGAFGSLYTVASADFCKTLFPNTAQRFIAGGDPAIIPTLAYEDLVDFYHSAYQPSNSTSMFYGDIDVERFLKVFDEEYFAGFDDTPTNTAAMETQEPFDAPVTATFDFPASADSTSTGSDIRYGVALPSDIGFESEMAFDLLTTVMYDSSSILMQAFYASGIASDYSCWFDYVGPQLIVVFWANDADPTRADEFKQIVLDSIAATIEEGLDEDLLDNAYAQVLLSEKLIADQKNVGVAMASRLAKAVNCNRPEMLDVLPTYEAAYTSLKGGSWKDLLQTYILDNTLAALVTVTPKPGLIEEQADALAQELAKKKAAMSDDQIAALVQATADFAVWNDSDVPDSTTQMLSVVDATKLDAIVPAHEIAKTQEDGITIMTADVDNDDISYCKFMIDLSALSIDQIDELSLLCMLYKCSTQDHSLQEVSLASGRYLYDGNCYIEGELIGDTALPFLYADFYCQNTDMAAAASIALEMALRTDLDDPDNLTQLQMAVDSAIQSFAYPEMLYGLTNTTSFADSSELYALRSALRGPSYYTFLKDMAERLSSEPDTVLSEMDMLRTSIMKSAGAYILYAGASASTAAMTDIAVEQLKTYADGSASAAASGSVAAAASGATSGSATAASGVVAAGAAGAASAAASGSAAAASSETSGTAGYSKLIAYIANTDAMYARAGYDTTAAGYERNGALMVASMILTDQVMTPTYRFQYGAYGSSVDCYRDGRITCDLYRAPMYYDFIDSLAKLPDELAQTSLSEAQLNGYKLPVVSDLVNSSGNFVDAKNQMTRELKGFTVADNQALVEETKEASIDMVLAASDELRDVIGKSTCIVVASAADIKEHADLFDETYDFQ